MKTAPKAKVEDIETLALAAAEDPQKDVIATLETMANHWKEQRDALEERLIKSLNGENTDEPLNTTAGHYKSERDKIEQEYLKMTTFAKSQSKKLVELQTEFDTLKSTNAQAFQ